MLIVKGGDGSLIKASYPPSSNKQVIPWDRDAVKNLFEDFLRGSSDQKAGPVRMEEVIFVPEIPLSGSGVIEENPHYFLKELLSGTKVIGEESGKFGVLKVRMDYSEGFFRFFPPRSELDSFVVNSFVVALLLLQELSRRFPDTEFLPSPGELSDFNAFAFLQEIEQMIQDGDYEKAFASLVRLDTSRVLEKAVSFLKI